MTTAYAPSLRSTSGLHLSAQEVETIQSLPKFNSHCHLGGEIPLSFIKKYSSAEQLDTIIRLINELKLGQEYEHCFSLFPLIAQLIDTPAKLVEATVATCEQMKKDNNQLVFLKTTPKPIGGNDSEEWVKCVLEGIRHTASDTFAVIPMLSVKRFSTPEVAKNTVDLALKYHIRWIDISDVSTKGDIRHILTDLRRAKENGINIAVHMGESPAETDQMLIINELKPDLIDHGVNLCEEARAWVEANNVPVTVCPTSSRYTKMHHESINHPWLISHLDFNHEIHLGTDDSTIFGDITLTSEFASLYPDLTFDTIIELATKSLEKGRHLAQIGMVQIYTHSNSTIGFSTAPKPRD